MELQPLLKWGSRSGGFANLLESLRIKAPSLHDRSAEIPALLFHLVDIIAERFLDDSVPGAKSVAIRAESSTALPLAGIVFSPLSLAPQIFRSHLRLCSIDTFGCASY